MATFSAHLLDAVTTVFAMSLLVTGGYLWALLLLPRTERNDSLLLAIGALILTTGQAVLIGLGLGLLGWFRLGLAVTVQFLIVTLALVLLRRRDSLTAGWASFLLTPIHHFGSRLSDRIRLQPALSLVVLHAVGSEVIRGLFRPPLSWDSLMYHLLLTATWVQRGDLAPFFGPYPINFVGLSPANGSIWLWWWMAPSHSDLYVNLSFLLHWALLGLAAGAVARELGAGRLWPVATLSTILTPVVLRFATAQYVDIFSSALLTAGAYFGLRWRRPAALSDVALASIAFGVAIGAKHMALAYAAGLILLIGLVTRCAWARRLRQAPVALAILMATGSLFWLRNLHRGLGLLFPFPNPILPLGVTCDTPVDNARLGGVGHHALTLWAMARPLWDSGRLLDAFLGINIPTEQEMGLGPQVLVLVAALAALPFTVKRSVRPVVFVVLTTVAIQLVVFCFVPIAWPWYIFGNMRFLLVSLAFACAALASVANRPGVPATWTYTFVVALALQDLLMLHSELTRQVRLTIAFLDLTAAALIFSPSLRFTLHERRRWLLPALTLLLLLATPVLATYRQVDRYRAFSQEYAVHQTPASVFARAWAWLERYGADGTVSVITEPETHFLYPAMGSRLQRRVVYTNVGLTDTTDLAAYPNCNPRNVPFVFDSWMVNLQRQDVRWLLVSRYGETFPPEDAWAARSERFVLRYSDPRNHLYELLPKSSASLSEGLRAS
jgi:hypothetical protein